MNCLHCTPGHRSRLLSPWSPPPAHSRPRSLALQGSSQQQQQQRQLRLAALLLLVPLEPRALQAQQQLPPLVSSGRKARGMAQVRSGRGLTLCGMLRQQQQHRRHTMSSCTASCRTWQQHCVRNSPAAVRATAAAAAVAVNSLQQEVVQMHSRRQQQQQQEPAAAASSKGLNHRPPH